MSYLSNKEYIEIRNIDGVHLAYFKGEALPAQIKTIITQDASDGDGSKTEATISFLVKLEDLKKDSHVFEISVDKLIGVIKKNTDRDNSHLI